MLAEQTTTNPASAALNIAELADRYTGLLHGIGRRYRLTPEECDDAAQSTWLALCQNADRIRDPQRIPGWLATTMRRFCAAQQSDADTANNPPPTSSLPTRTP